MESRRDKSKYLGKKKKKGLGILDVLALIQIGFQNLLKCSVLCRDLSMILCDPFACNTLVLSIMRNLQELLSQDALPRVSLHSLHNKDVNNCVVVRLFMR